MKYNFDEIVQRKHTDCLKYDNVKEMFGTEEILPMWIADMDFRTPDFIVDAIRNRLSHELLGYSYICKRWRPAIQSWVSRRYGWEIQTDEIGFVGGIVPAISFALQCFTNVGDKVMIQPPVYHPFRIVPQKNNHEVVFNPLRELPEGGYEMDFDNLEEVCDEKCKMLILANPHNPAGITWPREALEKLASFCHKKGIIVISDEIHSDMALFGNKHIPFASVSEEAAACSITFGAPSKTFNIAGIVSSYAIVPNDNLRKRFFDWVEASEFGAAHIFAPIATIAAYRKGKQWREQMLKYIEGNIEFIISYCEENIPQVKPLRPQASFLVWLDCRGTGLDHEQLIDTFINKAGLALNDGEMFNPGGVGFMRLNVGCPRRILETALENLKAALV